MDLKDRSYEPMDIDISNNSVKSMDISYSDSKNCGDRVKQEIDIDSTGIEGAPIHRERPASVASPRLVTKFLPVRVKEEFPGVSKKKERFLPVRVKEEFPGVSDDEILAEKLCKPVRKYHIIKKHSPKLEKTNLKYKVALSVAAVGFLSMVLYNMFSLKCCVVDIDLIEQRLSLSLFGQSEVTNEVVKGLKSQAKTKILFFIGGTGVGKTYAASLIIEGLRAYSNIFHFTMPSFQRILHENLMLGMSMCDNSIIVVDDLSTKDMFIKDEVNYLIQKSENSGKNLTLILIYNCDNKTTDFEKKCDFSFVNNLRQSFEDVKALKKYIKFNFLKEEHLKMCIAHELNNGKISEMKLENFARTFDVTQDGCKGVHTKIRLMVVN